MNRFKLLLAGILLFLFQNTSFASNAISNLITPVSYFVDHVKQLDDLKNNLAKYRQASIVGTSGIGKTQLARTYAYENKDKYNLIWFFDCNIDINHEFVRLAKQLNEKANAGLPEEPKQSKKALMDYLKDKDNWLLVFDNLKINENKKVQDLLDWEHNGNVIFCSQGIEAFPYTVAMSTFTNKDSLTLISKLLENKNKDDTNFLVKAFSGYPILIVQGTQLLNQIKGMDKENYKKRIYQSAEKIKLNVEFAMKQLTPSACQLLSKIALINSKNFSKDLLKIITDFPNNLNNDIFQLTKFMLITCIDSNEANPIFEMHDVIAQKTMEINNNKDNKQYLEDIITRLVDAVPKSVIKGRVFRSSKTIAENFEVIFKNAEKYSVDICKIMELNSNLTIHYANSLDFYSIERKISWFNENDKNGKFKPLFMSNDQKASYGAYLGIIGSYYRHRYADYEKATEYFVKSAAVFDKVHDYEFYKFNIICQLALINIGLGKTQELSQNVQQLEEMLDSDLIDREDIAFAHYIKARLLVIQGKYLEALKQINNAIEVVIKNGLNPNDLFLTSFYLLKTDVLSSLSRYQEAYVQIEQLYNMHKPGKKEDHQIFGRIYTQMAKAELGLGGIDKASDHITKALTIFLADEKRNPQNGQVSEDPDLAAGYVVQGDILTARGDIKQAIENYRDAQKIYFYLYKNNSGNIVHVSDLYLKGAKAACKLKDLYHYKAFGLPQVREFGNDHPNTITMFEYCKQYDMDLWKKEN